MFGKKKMSRHPLAMDTLIGEGSVFEGRLKTEAGIRIEGQFTGDIQCGGNVTVGEQAKVSSNVACRDIVIAGSVTGHVTAAGKLTITAKGRLYGNANAASLVIDEGGIFHGVSQMEKPDGTAERGPIPPVREMQQEEAPEEVVLIPPPVSEPVSAPVSEPLPEPALPPSPAPEPAPTPPQGQGRPAPPFGGDPVVL